MARVLGLKQLLNKKYHFLKDLPQEITDSFGMLVDNFIMIVWGMSANGKSNFIMQFLTAIIKHGRVLYVGLEEGFEASMQFNALRNLDEDEHGGAIQFANHEMTYDELVKRLKKRKSPRFIIIDSIQYFNITYNDYKALKEMFPKKSFIFISHASGKVPEGRTADKIRYDAGIKVRVEGFVAFVMSRYGGNKPYVIWEAGAKKYWGKKYRSVISGIPDEKKKKKPKKEEVKEETKMKIV